MVNLLFSLLSDLIGTRVYNMYTATFTGTTKGVFNERLGRPLHRMLEPASFGGGF